MRIPQWELIAAFKQEFSLLVFQVFQFNAHFKPNINMKGKWLALPS